MPHLLRDVMVLNNDCLQDMLRIPNEPERLINAFRILQHALRMLRNDASVAEMDFKAQQQRQRQEGCRMQQQSNSSRPQSIALSHRPEMSQHGALVPCGQRFSFPSYTDEFEANPSTDVYYSYDRPLLFHLTDSSSRESDFDDNDLDTMNFVCATVLFNLALICHRYAMTQSEGARSNLLLNSRKLYTVLIDLLCDIVGSNETSSTQQADMNIMAESDDEELRTSDDILLLLTLTYHCLGHLYYELGMFSESSECMMKLHYVFMSQNDVFDGIRLSYFYNIIDEIKLNIVFWKMHVPSPIAIAA